VATIRAAQPSSEGVFPFVLPWDDAAPGITDVSRWSPKPAGGSGHIRAGEDGHFYAGQERIRFLGVNLSFAGGMPRKDQGEKVAARLAKFGVNVVRFHHMDTGAWPGGLRQRTARGTGELEPEALERLCYFIAQLKQRGLYANLNLLVGRPFNAGDGLPAAIEKLDWKERHLVGFFDARHLELQQAYARKLLSHRNPYTGLTFADDPAVAFVEINNENGLIHAWHANDVDALPDVFLEDLRRQWNEWLGQRYASPEQLNAAWQTGEEPLGRELLDNGDFSRQAQRWNLEQHAGAQANLSFAATLPTALRPPAAATSAKVLRLVVNTPGAESWHVQLNQGGLRLEAGRSYTASFWARAEAPLSLSVHVSQAQTPWQNLGLSGSAGVDREWKPFRFVFSAGQGHTNARLAFSSLGGRGSVVELAGVSFRPGGVRGLQPEEQPGRVALFAKKTFGQRTPEAQRDWMRFLHSTEDRYWQRMARFLKEDLQVKALITGTIVGCSPPNLMAGLDWVDTHAYWQHPRFPRRPWDSEDWVVENRSMANERGGTLPGLALKRVAGKPHGCTEYNHPAPNTYCSEGFLLLAAYAALQDWDAIYVYSYAHNRNDGWDSRKINGFFDVDQHPTKMATLPAAAAIFRRGDVQAARQLVCAQLSREQEADLLRRAGAWSLVDGGTVGIPREAALVHRVALVTKGRAMPATARLPSALKLEPHRFAADTGELLWDLTNAKRGVVTIHTPRTKGVIGFGGQREFQLGELMLAPGEGLQDGWSVIVLTAMDEARRRWLLTATGYAENTGMAWKNADKNSVGRNWGGAPSRVEGVTARLTWTTVPERMQAWALDERGQRGRALPIATEPGRASIQIGPEWKTLWYEIELR
jgi:hypothetical protein